MCHRTCAPTCVPPRVRRPFFYVYDMGAGRVERVAGPAGCPGLKSLESFVVSPPG